MSSSAEAHPYTTRSAKDGDSLAFNLWKKCSRESVFTMYTPFVVCLASGILEKTTFDYYLHQDIYYLETCIKVVERALTTTEDKDAKEVLYTFKSGDESELKRITDMLNTDTKPPIHSATSNYEQFFRDTVSGKIEGHANFHGPIIAVFIFGAMMPCWRLYAALGQRILDALGGEVDDSHPYKDWIESNGSKKLEELTQKVERVLNMLCSTLSREQLDIIEKLYQKSMMLEVEFFLAPTISQSTVVPLTREHDPAKNRLLILSGFERTCAVVESSVVFADIAIRAAEKFGNQLTRMSSAEIRAKWGFLFALHEEEYEQRIENIMASEKKAEFNYEAVQNAIETFSVLERRANIRVIESGVLGGLRQEDIKQAGRRQVLLDGCSSFFQKLTKNRNLNANINLLSHCWSDELIKSAFLSEGLNGLKVYANQLAVKESSTTGNIIRNIESPVDKLRVFNIILKDYNDYKSNFTVYIGDSIEDLLCLLNADIGIVIGPSSSLQRVGGHLGVSFTPLYPSLLKKQKEATGGSSPIWKKQSGILYTVSSWAEVDAFILGW